MVESVRVLGVARGASVLRETQPDQNLKEKKNLFFCGFGCWIFQLDTSVPAPHYTMVIASWLSLYMVICLGSTPFISNRSNFLIISYGICCLFLVGSLILELGPVNG